MDKILFLGQGSERDPEFDDVFVEGMPYKEFMKEKGIGVLRGYVESCHGCYDLMSKYSRQLQSLVEDGKRVVAVLQGGLMFGLPSIQATQTTFPIISVPLDYVSYTAFMVPSGNAAIATVGVDSGRSDREKAKALSLAERILNLENPGVNVFADNSQNQDKLVNKLNELRVWNYKGGGEDALSLVYGGADEMKKVPQDSFAIRADSDENPHCWDYLKKAEHRHHLGNWNEVPAMQVRGLDNLAIFAAKIISLQRAELISVLKDIAIKKRISYPVHDVFHELQGAS